MIEIRLAVSDDIPDLIELRHERALLQRKRVTPDARDLWSMELHHCLGDPESVIYVAVSDNQLIGYVMGRVQTSSVGLIPERSGVISELALDLHQYQGGIGRSLVNALRDWFRSCPVESIFLSVSQRLPVEQAFWRALGTEKWMEILWIT
jgi:hypothetical protein